LANKQLSSLTFCDSPSFLQEDASSSTNASFIPSPDYMDAGRVAKSRAPANKYNVIRNSRQKEERRRYVATSPQNFTSRLVQKGKRETGVRINALILDFAQEEHDPTWQPN
jgi:hypothetical protein